MANPRDKTRNTLNYFGEFLDGIKDNAFVIRGSSIIDDQLFTAEQFREGLTGMIKIDNFYYFQDPDDPQDQDYRIFSNGIYLDFERYDGASWVRQFRIGGSAFVERFIEIEKEVNADLLVNDDGDIRNLIRSASFSNGTVIADIDGPTFIISDGNLYDVETIEDQTWKVLQSDDSQDSTGTSFYVDNTTLSVDGFVSSEIRVRSDLFPSGLKAQLKIFLQSDLVTPVWENVTDVELENGNGEPVNVSTGEILLKPKFYGTGNTDLRLVVNFDQEVTLKGSTTDGTDIYFESFDATVSFFRTEKVTLGEIKIFDVSRTGAMSVSELQSIGWAICDGTTPVSQGITNPIIETTPNVQDKFLRMSSDETSGTIGGVDSNQFSWATGDVDDNGESVVGTIEGTTSGTKVFDNKPPFYEFVYFIRVK